MKFLRQIYVLLRLSLVTEGRSKNALLSSALFILLSQLIFSFSLSTDYAMIHQAAPAILWVTIIFCGTLIINHLSSRYTEDDFHEGLVFAGVDSVAMFLGRFLSCLMFLSILQVMLLLTFAILFNYSLWPHLGPLLTVFLLGSVGFCAIGTVISCLLRKTRGKDLLLPIVFYPIVIPLMIVATQSTTDIFAGEPVRGLGFLLGFDLILITACALLYEYIVEDLS